MPRSCGVVGCRSIESKDKKSFYRLPAELKKGTRLKVELSYLRRKKWIIAIRRSDLTENKKKYLWICEDHFISGRPSEIYDLHNPDWAPSLNMGYELSCDDSSNFETNLNSPSCASDEELVDGTNNLSTSQYEPEVLSTSDAVASHSDCTDENVDNLVKFCYDCSKTIAGLKEID